MDVNSHHRDHSRYKASRAAYREHQARRDNAPHTSVWAYDAKSAPHKSVWAYDAKSAPHSRGWEQTRRDLEHEHAAERWHGRDHALEYALEHARTGHRAIGHARMCDGLPNHVSRLPGNTTSMPARHDYRARSDAALATRAPMRRGRPLSTGLPASARAPRQTLPVSACPPSLAASTNPFVVV